jgi:hypothetical protein
VSVSHLERPRPTALTPPVAPADDIRDVSSPPAWPLWKVVVSLWLAFHAAAIVIYPASILVPERGLLAQIRNAFFERYMEALYMVQGHRFFSPEPGPGTLVEYTIEGTEGTSQTQVFPRREIRPRLLYHRYFMLSERVQDVDDPEAWYWMYARHLLKQEGGEAVALHRIVHLLPTPDDIIAGKQLDDPEFYEREELGRWTKVELEQPSPPRRESNTDGTTISEDQPAAGVLP